jgi:hypothetical protein
MNAYTRLPGESRLEHALRRQRIKADARNRADPIVTDEARRQGGYIEEDVMHVETGTRAVTFRRKSISSLVRLHQTGRLDNEQYEAALRIARVAERMERDVGVRGSTVTRVDCANTARDALVEHLGQVRDEATYSRWRKLIPLPRRMILDMVLIDRPLATTARIYGKRWESTPRTKGGRELFTDALDLWIDLRGRVGNEIDERDLLTAHARLLRAA